MDESDFHNSRSRAPDDRPHDSGSSIGVSRAGMRWLVHCVALACVVAACNYAPWLAQLTEPEGASPVLGGIADTRPMFGKTHDPTTGAEQGDFLLATCGCGDWRVLIQDADGSQHQCAMRYFAAGDYSAEGDIDVFGGEGELVTRGVVNQTTGTASGEIDVNLFRRRFTAERRETHENNIEACILCHVGENPIYPRPPTHPEYVPGVTNCFDCHDVVIE